jgi:RND superfamily putative drug exporter
VLIGNANWWPTKPKYEERVPREAADGTAALSGRRSRVRKCLSDATTAYRGFGGGTRVRYGEGDMSGGKG